MKIRFRHLSLKETIIVLMRQRQFTTYETVVTDEALPYGKNDRGEYFRVEGEIFTLVEAREIAVEYLRNGFRVPDDFIEVRNALASVL